MAYRTVQSINSAQSRACLVFEYLVMKLRFFTTVILSVKYLKHNAIIPIGSMHNLHKHMHNVKVQRGRIQDT